MSKKMRGFDTYNNIAKTLEKIHGKEIIPISESPENIQVLKDATEYVDTVDLMYGVLVGKIGLQIFKQKFSTNPFEVFKGDDLRIGDKIEKIHINLTSSTDFVDDAVDVFAKAPQDIDTEFFTVDIRKHYKISISDEQMINGLSSYEALAEITSQLIAKMYQSATQEEYDRVKNLLGDFTPHANQVVEIAEIEDETTGKALVKAIKEKIRVFERTNTKYNYSQRSQSSMPENLALIITASVEANIDVEVLAYAFNKENLALGIKRIIVVEDFGTTNTNTRAILMDEDFLQIRDQLKIVKSIENPTSLYRNYFLHVWQVAGLSKFEQAVYFDLVPAP